MSELSMANRLAQIIEYKADGNRSAFGESLGWSKQYVNKLLKGESIGISVVTSIVEKYADINARWLLTGEGNMVDSSHILRMLRAWFELDEYVPVMTPAEQAQLSDGRLNWGEDDVARWRLLRNRRDAQIRERFAKSMQKSGKNCK